MLRNCWAAPSIEPWNVGYRCHIRAGSPTPTLLERSIPICRLVARVRLFGGAPGELGLGGNPGAASFVAASVFFGTDHCWRS